MRVFRSSTQLARDGQRGAGRGTSLRRLRRHVFDGVASGRQAGVKLLCVCIHGCAQSGMGKPCRLHVREGSHAAAEGGGRGCTAGRLCVQLVQLRQQGGGAGLACDLGAALTQDAGGIHALLLLLLGGRRAVAVLGLLALRLAGDDELGGVGGTDDVVAVDGGGGAEVLAKGGEVGDVGQGGVGAGGAIQHDVPHVGLHGDVQHGDDGGHGVLLAGLAVVGGGRLVGDVAAEAECLKTALGGAEGLAGAVGAHGVLLGLVVQSHNSSTVCGKEGSAAKTGFCAKGKANRVQSRLTGCWPGRSIAAEENRRFAKMASKQRQTTYTTSHVDSLDLAAGAGVITANGCKGQMVRFSHS